MSDTNKSGGTGKEEGEKKGDLAKFGILGLGLVIGILIGVAVGAFLFPQAQIQGFNSAIALTQEEAGEKAADFIYAVAPGVDVELINVTEVEGENLYKIVINLSAMGMSQTAESYMTKDGHLLFPQGIDLEEFEEMVEQQKEQEENQTQESQNTTIGNFIVSGDEICMEDEKPIIYFFGSDGCPACKWEYPVIANVTVEFEGYISFHDNMNNLTADREIFSKYSTGGVPTLVLGCKYYRVGSGASMGEAQEANVLTALICDLTGNKPVDVCSEPEVAELINEI